MSAGRSTQSAAPSSTIDRFSLVMNLFRETSRLTLTEAARRTGIPRTSTLRLLERLVRLGWLRRHGTWYELGDVLAEFEVLALNRHKFDLVVTPLLHELHRVTGCVVHLGSLEGKQVRYLAKVGGQAAPELRTQVGARVPAHSSTMGKALLAAGRRPGTDPGVTGFEPGVAFGTCVTGYGCVGVHVGTLRGTAVGLSVSGPPNSVRFDRWHAAPVQMTAFAIARYLD